MIKSVAHYDFSIEEVLAALDRKMRDEDHKNGLTFFPAGKGPGPQLFHRVRYDGDRFVIDLFDTPPDQPLKLKPGPKFGPRTSA